MTTNILSDFSELYLLQLQENRRLQLDLKQEQAMTEKSIEPLKVHLADLEGAVQEQLDK